MPFNLSIFLFEILIGNELSKCEHRQNQHVNRD